MVARLRRMQEQMLAAAGLDERYAAIPIPGSATLANEMVLRALPPPGSAVLVATNGAYGDWIASLCHGMGRSFRLLRGSPREPLDPGAIVDILERDPSLSHVAMVHLETSTGLLNPVDAVAAACRALGRGLILDAVASFGILPLGSPPPQAVVVSSNKCLQGPPGLAWALVRRGALEAGRGFAGSACLDLFDQHQHVERTGTFRFTPPTHVVAGVAAALDEHAAEGAGVRLARYRANRACLLEALTGAGLEPLVADAHAAPVVAAFAPPPHRGYTPEAFVAAAARRGYVLAPGRLPVPDSLRVGCIGAIEPPAMRVAAAALAEALAELDGAP
jgi:2-aminoethylphosphonate-pyruvate transaminase